MYRSIFIGLFLFLGLSAANAQKGSKEMVIKTQVYCDHCDVCETCKSNVEAALFKVKGVKLCEMNSAAKTIRVVYNPKKTDDVTIRKTICACGYDADEMKATEEGLSKLDGCCRKKE